nr:MAG TPA: hypothetical protein [Bacteriophage sp.]
MTSLKGNFVLLSNEFLDSLFFEFGKTVTLQLGIKSRKLYSRHADKLVSEFSFFKRFKRIIPFPKSNLFRFYGCFHLNYIFCY